VKEVTEMIDFSGGPGFAAFVATFSVVLVTLVLMRSFNKQLRKIRTSPPEDGAVLSSEAASGIEDDNGGGNEVTGESRDR
jgi:hypothetical protein